MSSKAILWLLTWIAIAGCETHSIVATQALIHVTSDFGDRLQRVEVTVTNARDAEGNRASFSAAEFALAGGPAPEFSFTVVPAAGSDRRDFAVEAVGLGSGGDAIVRSSGSGRFVDGVKLDLWLRLAQLCEDVICEGGRTCVVEDGTALCGQRPPLQVDPVRDPPALDPEPTPKSPEPGLRLRDEGFELGPRVCTRSAQCLTAGFTTGDPEEL